MEVHASTQAAGGVQGGSIHQVQHLLESKGFSNIVVEQDPVLSGSNIYMLYAKRS